MRRNVNCRFLLIILCLSLTISVSEASYIPLRNDEEVASETVGTSLETASCKCENGYCEKDAAGNEVCKCPVEFGNLSSTKCKECKCGKLNNCTFVAKLITTSKTCVCRKGYELQESWPESSCKATCKENPCQNGGVCKVKNQDIECACKSGYSGDLCEITRNIPVCDEDGNGKIDCNTKKANCVEDASANGGYKCVCPPFMQPDKLEVCRDKCEYEGKEVCQKKLQRCELHDADKSQYICVDCAVGQKINDDGQCIEMDACEKKGTKECKTKKQVCVVDETDNTKFNCRSCPEGQKINEEGKCIEMNACDKGGKEECKARNQICVLAEDEFYCMDCPPRKKITEDGRCIDICIPDLCDNGGICSPVEEDDSCYCKEGFFGKFCEFGTCDKNPCKNGGNCSLWSGREICSCPVPFFGPECEASPCDSSPCENGGICTVQGENIHCSCPESYIGKFCEMSPCDFYSCENGGKCRVENERVKCDCPEPFTGDMCETSPCDFSPCENDGKCRVENQMMKCDCPKPFTGEKCEKSPCDFSICENDGKCRVENQLVKCDCLKPFTGDKCEKSPCDPNPCLNGGQCTPENGSIRCLCVHPYFGKKCEERKASFPFAFYHYEETVKSKSFVFSGINNI